MKDLVKSKKGILTILATKCFFRQSHEKMKTNKLWWKIFEENEEKNCRNIEENAIKKRKKQNSQTAT